MSAATSPLNPASPRVVSPPERKKRASPLPFGAVSSLHICRRLHKQQQQPRRRRVASDKRRRSDERHVSQEASREGCVSVATITAEEENFRTLLPRHELRAYTRSSRICPLFLPRRLPRRKGTGRDSADYHASTTAPLPPPPPRLVVPCSLVTSPGLVGEALSPPS
jgi:hypothetical protein